MALRETDQEYKGKLLRVFREIMLLYNTPFGLSINELAAKLGVSYRTIYRDLRLLRESGFFPEEVHRGKYVIRGIDAEVKKFQKNLQFNAVEAGLLSKAVASIPDTSPMKKSILEKLLAFSGVEDLLKVAVKQDISRNYEVLSTAAREKKQVILRNYRSSHSGSIRDRIVEPYAFAPDGATVKCFEPSSDSNKTFKIERVEDVTLTPTKWKHQKQHEAEQKQDIFGILGEKSWEVRLRMSLRAANLMREEYPLSRSHIYKDGVSEYAFDADVTSFIAIGRFILGLLDEIKVESPRALKDYLNDKVNNRQF